MLKRFCLLAVCALLCALCTAQKFVVVLDAGHGGHDPGAPGKFSKEKDNNLAVALRLGTLIEQNCPDVKVVYTRRRDVFIALGERAAIANRAKADLFISIHTNASTNPRAYGASTYTLGMHRAASNLEVAKRENSVITYEEDYREKYAGFDPSRAESYVIFEFMQDRNMSQSVELARDVQQCFRSAGRSDIGVHQAGFLVLRETSMPAILVEMGFISNPTEEAFLASTEGRDVIARGIYNGFVKYLAAHSSISAKPVAVSTATASAETAQPAASTQTPAAAQQKPAASTQTPATAQPAAADSAEKGIVYKVQVYMSEKPLKESDPVFKGLSPIGTYRDGTAYKYTFGAERTYAAGAQLQRQVRQTHPDAFLVAFRDGQRIPIAEARKISDSLGSAGDAP